MNISANKSISSLVNPELKFLISLSKNKIRKSENKSLAEGYRENKSLISSDYEIDTLYICEELFIGEEGPILIADQIEKPGNLGTMIRTAKSLGVMNIFCSDEITDFYNPNVIRASIGHIFSMNLISDTTTNIINLLKAKEYQIILMDPDSDNQLKGFRPEYNFALVIGSEQYGISEKWSEINNIKLKIESINEVDSINASTAAAISLWELLR